MKKGILILVIAILTSCSKQSPQEILDHVDGYWEIQRVVTPDGYEKDFKVNTQYDYYQLKDSTGIRYKVEPLLLGGYRTTNTPEVFKIDRNEKTVVFTYNGTEGFYDTIITATDETLEIESSTGSTYYYKRHTPTEPIE